jgi:hypothetical protein
MPSGKCIFGIEFKKPKNNRIERSCEKNASLY